MKLDKCKRKYLKVIFSNLLWPAVAGNILWVCLSLLIDPKVQASLNEHNFYYYSATPFICLLGLAVYTAIGCVRHSTLKNTPKNCLEVVFGLSHILLIGAMAIAIIFKPSLFGGLLIVMFSLTALKHAFESEFKYFSINFLGFCISLTGTCAKCDCADTLFAVAIWLVLILWGLFKWKEVQA